MPILHLETVIAGAVFAGVRIGSLLLFPPFLGSEAIAAPVKAGLTVALTALLWPVYGPLAVQVDAVGWLRVVSGEIIVGLLLGLSLQFVFEAVQFAGQVMGIQAGFSLITLLDPQTQADTPVLSVFSQLLVLLIFFRLNVHHWLLRGLAASFAYVPPGSALAGRGVGLGLLQAAGGIWLAGLQMAAPVLAATLVADVALGFLGKASPQLPVVFVGLSVKTVAGLAVLAGAVSLWPRIFEKEFPAAVGWGERLLHLAK